MIEIKNLNKTFGSCKALNDLNITVKPGEIFGLLGPNGAGKTTAVKIISGILRPTSGTVLIGGHDILTDTIEAKRTLAYIPDEPFVYPKRDFSYCANILNMMFSSHTSYWELDDYMVKALNLLLILHAEHEQNCSTSTVRLVGSSKTNLYSSISSGICALWGPLHGGTNQKVIEMLNMIHQSGAKINKFIEKAKDKNDPFRLMGFGHRVYKNFDPRARIIKKAADDVLEKLGVQDPILDIAKKLEEIALKDPYFVERKLYPNVDFYSGIIYRALGIPVDMFTVMFALGRLPGWIAQWKELRESKEPIGRPRQIYTGHQMRPYVTVEKR